MHSENEKPNDKDATIEIETAKGSESKNSLWEEYHKDNEDDRGIDNGMSAADMEL